MTGPKVAGRNGSRVLQHLTTSTSSGANRLTLTSSPYTTSDSTSPPTKKSSMLPANSLWQSGVRVRQECYLPGNRNFVICLNPLRSSFRCFLSITTEYTIRRTRSPVWVSRYDSHLGSQPSVLISDTLASSMAFFLNLTTLVSFPSSFTLSRRFFISPPNQLPSKTPAIEPLTAHGRSDKNPAKRKREPPRRPTTNTDRVKPGPVLQRAARN